MDGCVREGNWLNLTSPWVAEADELQPCYENIQPGSYFPGTGFAIFNTSGGNTLLNYPRYEQVFTLLYSITSFPAGPDIAFMHDMASRVAIFLLLLSRYS